MVRQMLRFGLTGGGGGAAAPEDGAAVPGDRVRDVGLGREGASPPTATSTATSEADRRGGGGNASTVEAGAGAGSFEAVAQQLLEIFPDMEWGAALRAAMLANGSTERAVEYALSGDNSGQGVGSPGDDPVVGAPSTWLAGEHLHAGGGSGDVAEGRRRWWS